MFCYYDLTCDHVSHCPLPPLLRAILHPWTRLCPPNCLVCRDAHNGMPRAACPAGASTERGAWKSQRRGGPRPVSVSVSTSGRNWQKQQGLRLLGDPQVLLSPPPLGLLHWARQGSQWSQQVTFLGSANQVRIWAHPPPPSSRDAPHIVAGSSEEAVSSPAFCSSLWGESLRCGILPALSWGTGYQCCIQAE